MAEGRAPRRSRRGGARERERREWQQTHGGNDAYLAHYRQWEEDLRWRENQLAQTARGAARAARPRGGASPAELPWCLVCDETLREGDSCKVPPPSYRDPNLEARDAGPGAPYPSGYWGRVHSSGCYAVLELERQVDAIINRGATLPVGALRRLAAVVTRQTVLHEASAERRRERSARERDWDREAARRFPELVPEGERSRTPRR